MEILSLKKGDSLLLRLLYQVLNYDILCIYYHSGKLNLCNVYLLHSNKLAHGMILNDAKHWVSMNLISIG